MPAASVEVAVSVAAASVVAASVVAASAAGASVSVDALLPHAAKDIVITAAIPNAVNFLNFIFVSSL